MKSLCMLLLVFPGLFYAQENPPVQAKSLLPPVQAEADTAGLPKSGAEQIDYKILVHTLENPERYYMQVHQPEVPLASLRRLQPLPEKENLEQDSP